MNFKQTTLKTSIAGLIAAGSFFIAGVASADTYTVESGDTLSEIATTFNTTVDELVSLNAIADANIISVGQELEVGDNDATTTDADTSAATDSTTTEVAETTEESTTTTTTTGSYMSNLSAEDAAAKEVIAQRESSGSYTAQNGQYYGRYQLTISYLNGDLSAENQERVADAYVAGRYGSWSAALAFWNANGWY